jgi:hypothetical protein
VKENISRARKSAVILAFSAGAAALLALVVAWFAACEGGRHRDGTPRRWYGEGADPDLSPRRPLCLSLQGYVVGRRGIEWMRDKSRARGEMPRF